MAKITTIPKTFHPHKTIARIMAARRSVDYVIVDLHPSYSLLNRAIFDKADRILVLYRGRLALELTGSATTDHEVLHAINTGQPMDPADAAVAHAQEEGTP